MNVAPGATYEVVFPIFEPDLAGTIGTRVDDNEGTTATAYDESNIADISDAGGVYSCTARVAPTTKGQYTIILSVGVDGEVLGTEPLNVTSNAPQPPPTSDTYATTDELAEILTLRTPTDDQVAAMTRVLQVATGEINAEIDLDEGDSLGGWQLALAAEVNLERAVEHWQQMKSPFGIVGLGDAVSTYTARDSWDRHAHKLAPLKANWGLA